EHEAVLLDQDAPGAAREAEDRPLAPLVGQDVLRSVFGGVDAIRPLAEGDLRPFNRLVLLVPHLALEATLAGPGLGGGREGYSQERDRENRHQVLVAHDVLLGGADS